MHSRTWITGELAFAGQVLDDHTEKCAVYANETLNLLEGVLKTRTDVATQREVSRRPTSLKQVGQLTSHRPSTGAKIVSLERSEIVLQKRSCLSPARSPAHKKMLVDPSPLRRPAPVPGSHTARRAASRSIQPVESQNIKRQASRAPLSCSPTKPQASTLRSPRKPLVEVSNVSTKGGDSKMETRPVSAAKQTSPRKKDRELTGLARLLVPTSASAARVQAIRNQMDHNNSPLTRKNEVDSATATSRQIKPSAAGTRVNSAGSIVPQKHRTTANSNDLAGKKPTNFTNNSGKPSKPITSGNKIKPVKSSAPVVSRLFDENAKRPINQDETKPPFPVSNMHEQSVTTLVQPTIAMSSAVAPSGVTAKPSADRAMPPPSAPMPKLTIPLSNNFMKAQVPHQIQVVGLPPIMQAEATLPDISDSSEGSILQEWAYTPEVASRIRRQVNIDPVSVFGPIKPVQMNTIFKRRMRPRTSSAVWDKDGLTSQERQQYNEHMGFNS